MDEGDLKKEVLTLDEQVKAIVVKDPETYQAAGAMVLNLDALKKRIVEYWKGPKDAAYRAHKEVTAKEAEMIKPVEERRRMLNQKISSYLTEQERLRRMEQERIDDERKKKEDDERDKLFRKAEKADTAGRTEKAAELRDKADAYYVSPVIVQPEIEKSTKMDAGTVTQKTKIEVVIRDEMEVLRAIIAGTIPISCVEISVSKLEAHVKAFKLKLLPGCDVTEKMVASFRGAK